MRFDARDPRWTPMARLTGSDGATVAVYEDFTVLRGTLALVTEPGAGGGDPDVVLLPKSAEPSRVDPAGLLLGRTPAEVFDRDDDLLGAELLGRTRDQRADDPDPAVVAAVLPPIATMGVHSFVGTPANPDKVGITLGGVTANVDPAQYQPAVAAARDAGRVLDGLVGGWLPVLRFVFPEQDGDPDAPGAAWTELLLFAPFDSPSGNARTQPVRYRVVRVQGGRPTAVDHVDTYPANPPRSAQPAPEDFYRGLLELRAGWQAELAGAASVELPDARLADQARHSLVRARMTRVDDWPKYGVLERNYGGAEHDGFQDTFTTDTAAALDWGLFDTARRYLDNYLTEFVRDDGSLVYRGPGTGQYGRMLTVLARYHRLTGDTATLLAHRPRIDAIAELLRTLPREHGVPVGWCEADSCLEAEPDRYRVPYLSNAAETARGFADLGAVWQRIGAQTDDPALVTRGELLVAESATLRTDLGTLIDASTARELDPPWLPVVAGDTVPFHVAVPADDHHPQFRAYRAHGELLHSGVLTAAQVRTVLDYRAAHRDSVLGVPAAYGFSRDPDLLDGNREMAGFLAHQHGYGLLQHDLVREYLLLLAALSAHQYTRGTWTAPETRRIRPGSPAAAYCAPAQLTVPLLVRWALVFEDPDDDLLWLGRACPRAWFADGERISVTGAPTRWGPVGFRIDTRDGRTEAVLELPAEVSVRMRLRLGGPGPTDAHRPLSVRVDDREWDDVDHDDPAGPVVALPPGPARSVTVIARRG